MCAQGLTWYSNAAFTPRLFLPPIQMSLRMPPDTSATFGPHPSGSLRPENKRDGFRYFPLGQLIRTKLPIETGPTPALTFQQRNEGRSPSMIFSSKIGLGVMGLFAAVIATNAPATAQQPSQKPNILFIMGDDIGWMQPSIYHQGLVRENWICPRVPSTETRGQDS